MKRYVYNEETLTYEEMEVPRWRFIGSLVVRALLALALVFGFFVLYLDVLKLELPKTMILKRRNEAWQAKFELLDRDMDRCDAILSGIEDRDDEVYRSIFGMDPVPAEVRSSGFGGTNRYEYLNRYGANESLKGTTRRLDILLKRAYLQSVSLDEVSKVSKQAGDMPSCIPSVPPIVPQTGSYRLSSPYGYRSDPISRRFAFHEGQDFASHTGNPVYATGDGTVEVVRYQFRGYGNEIVIDHGYGYKTRYAHLKTTEVVAGMRVRRGDRIGTLGNTGKSTGPHLHYEILFKGSPIDPLNFMDLSMNVSEYKAMTAAREAERASARPSVSSMSRRQKKQKSNGRK